MRDDPEMLIRYSRSVVKSIPRKRSRLAALLRVLPALQSADECVDVGTGSGGFALFFAKAARWTFVDTDEAHLAAARRMLDGVFILSNGESFLRNESRQFRLITTLGTMYYIQDHEQFFRLVRQRLLNDGHFVVSGDDIAASAFFGPLRRMLRLESPKGGRRDTPYKEFRRSLEAAGFVLELEARSTGPATLAFQTILDGVIALYLRARAIVISDKGSPGASPFPEERLLTQPLAGEPGRLRLKRFALLPLRTLSKLCEFLDNLFRFQQGYDYVICATPK